MSPRCQAKNACSGSGIRLAPQPTFASYVSRLVAGNSTDEDAAPRAKPIARRVALYSAVGEVDEESEPDWLIVVVVVWKGPDRTVKLGIAEFPDRHLYGNRFGQLAIPYSRLSLHIGQGGGD